MTYTRIDDVRHDHAEDPVCATVVARTRAPHLRGRRATRAGHTVALLTLAILAGCRQASPEAAAATPRTPHPSLRPATPISLESCNDCEIWGPYVVQLTLPVDFVARGEARPDWDARDWVSKDGGTQISVRLGQQLATEDRPCRGLRAHVQQVWSRPDGFVARCDNYIHRVITRRKGATCYVALADDPHPTSVRLDDAIAVCDSLEVRFPLESEDFAPDRLPTTRRHRFTLPRAAGGDFFVEFDLPRDVWIAPDGTLDDDEPVTTRVALVTDADAPVLRHATTEGTCTPRGDLRRLRGGTLVTCRSGRDVVHARVLRGAPDLLVCVASVHWPEDGDLATATRDRIDHDAAAICRSSRFWVQAGPRTPAQP